MIKTEKNENFTGLFNVWAFGKLVNQIQGRIKANAFAMDLAKANGKKFFVNHRNKITEVN